ncbi:MAG: nicotinamide riboside transporter PnuC [Gammaproteobacteria bacterium]|nr:nicotinamide riboside transporter PnuC [Gammaproteobacteria bacterium]MDH5629958.1 nicotinamide riboside transporter PnuC [Gammaproteobacteria bacterium]
MIDFITQMFGSRPIEITAVICGFLNVYLLVRRSIWNYLFGIVMVSLYAKIFYEYQLYSDAILQVYFFVFQIYGFYYWWQGKTDDGTVKVDYLPNRIFIIYLVMAAFIWIIWSMLMSHYTNASHPFWDGSIAVLSMLAQFLLARRHIQNWYLWIVVDVLAIGLFIVKKLEPTAALYFVFLIMCIIGLKEWRKVAKSS